MASLDQISDWLRREIIVPSGGWLADIVPLISDASAIWDVFVLAAIFVASWVVLRVSDSLTSFILGLGFDLTIPLQHYLNPNLIKQHQAHLDGYWPIITFATGVEAMCFFLIHPDLFTLVVCIKTMLMLAIWLGRRSDGSFITAGRGTGNAFKSSFPSANSSRSPSSRETPSGDRDRNRDKDRNRDRDRGQERPREDRTATPSDASNRSSEAPSSNEKPRERPRRPGTPPPERSSDPSRGPPQGGRRPPRDDLDEYAPPGLGPPITEADLADDLAERAERRRRRSKPPYGSNGSGPSEPDAYGYDSDDGYGSGDVGAGFFERFKKFRRTKDKPNGPGHREPPSPPDLYTTRPGGRIAPPGMTQHQHGHTVGKGGYKGIYLDESSSDFQCPIELADEADPSKKRLATRAERRNDRITAPWERALDHDSIDLLSFYLWAEGVHDHVRGWIIMDILEERDEAAARNLALGWKEVYQLPLTSEIRKKKIRQLLEPYRSFQHRQDVWRPAVGDWWSRARFGAHGGKINVEYGLDDLLWKMRASGVSPSARHAMVRDLLSMPSEDAYLQRKKKLLSAVERKDKWVDPVKYKAMKDRLVHHYQVMTDFGGQFVISQTELAEVAEEMMAAKVPRPTIGKVLKEVRWNLPEGGWRGVMNRFQDSGGW